MTLLESLHERYTSAQGRLLRRRVAAALRLPKLGPSHCVVGYGYSGPYMLPLLEAGVTCLNLMPAELGAIPWPMEDASPPGSSGGVLTTLVEEHLWPLPDATADHVLCIHGLEMALNPSGVISELWRTLTPLGICTVVIPTPWFRLIHGPQAPWSAPTHVSWTTILGLLKKQGFTGVEVGGSWVSSWISGWISGYISGLIVISAQKVIAQPVSAPSLSRAQFRLKFAWKRRWQTS